MLVLVPLGEDPKTAKNRIIIPQVKGNHRLAVLPCLIAGLGIYEHGKTFTKGNFHYNCKNGTAEVIGMLGYNNWVGGWESCVSDDMSVIQIGRTFLKEGIRHRCEVKGQTVTYEQKSTCYENGIHYDIVIGCFNSNGSAEYKPGQIWTEKHIRYQCSREGMTKVLGCVDGNGLFIELGHDVLMGGTVHRCYRIKNTTFYHR
uniref:Abnormal cell migration protein 18-like fibronectin type I domain-containing protein n=1 Tax=Meloidogyne floridensis TaxID=298350 RepID=A0A915P117_9BILA